MAARVSRRTVLSLLGLGGAAAFLASCGDSPASRIVADLPDPLAPLSPTAKRGVTSDREFAPPTPTKPLPPAVTSKEPDSHGIRRASAQLRPGLTWPGSIR